MADELKPVCARQMEVYAGFMEHTDHHIGRLLDTLGDLEILDDTLVYLMVGDNGASAEGTVNGTFNETLIFNGAAEFETAESMAAHIDDFGTPDSYNHYAVGWAHAMDTPYQWTKQVASHWGGTRNGTVVHWPNGIKAKGEVRTQFHHVIDIAATVLDVAGLARARVRERHPADADARREHGVRVRRPTAPERHETQYFEMFCNRGIYHKGWTAVTRHSTPWVMAASCPRSTTTCGSSTTDTDWTQAHDLAASIPTSLRELQRLWLIEAVKYNVLPLDDRRIERFNSDIAGTPAARQGDVAAAVRWHGTPERELGAQPEEQVARGHRRDRGSRRRRERRDHRPGRRVRRLEPVPARRASPRTATTCSGSTGSRSPATKRCRRRPPGAHGVRVRRRRARQGRRRHALHRRQQVGEGAPGGHASR